MSTVNLLERIRDMAVERMNRIISEFKESLPTEAEHEGVKAESEATVAEDDEEEGFYEASATEVAKLVPPAPIGTGPREGIPEGLRKVSKSDLIRDFFEKNPDAENKDLIEHFRKKNIEIKPSLVSTVKTHMGTRKEKRKRGRPVGSTKVRAEKATAKAEKKSGLTMVEAAVRVVAKSKDGLRVNKILEGVKKYYSYRGEQGDQGLKNCLNQALYALSQKKNRRGWKGNAPVILHDKESHTWRLNPKAERQTA